jgi:hypothetical protein
MTKVRQYAEVALLPPGLQAQVDMGEKVMKDFYGNKVGVYIFAMVIAYDQDRVMSVSENESDLIPMV